MMLTSKVVLAAMTVAGLLALPAISQAESAKAGASSTKSAASADEFEENRRAHMQKSKENNTNKGAN